MKTEVEARQCWCPFARPVEGGRNRTSNRVGVVANSFCIASECMAWRWDESPERIEVWTARIGEAAAGQPKGYCGLAGNP